MILKKVNKNRIFIFFVPIKIFLKMNIKKNFFIYFIRKNDTIVQVKELQCFSK